MFRTTTCPSSEGLIVSIRHLLYVIVCRWPSGLQVCIPELHLYRVKYTRCCIDTINPPDEGHLLTYLLTPWCRILLEKLTGLQLVKKFPAFHGSRWFITALTSVRHLSLSRASPIQSIYPHPTSWRSILILSTHLRLGLPNGLTAPNISKFGQDCLGVKKFSWNNYGNKRAEIVGRIVYETRHDKCSLLHNKTTTDHK